MGLKNLLHFIVVRVWPSCLGVMHFVMILIISLKVVPLNTSCMNKSEEFSTYLSLQLVFKGVPHTPHPRPRVPEPR